MAYEPVLAPKIVTGDLSLTMSRDSGFRHYLRSISASFTPTHTPTTHKTISTAFINPTSELVDDNRLPSARKEYPARLTSSLHQPDSGSMASLILPSSATIGPDNVFHENGIPSLSTLSSPFESPNASLNNGHEEIHEPIRRPTKRSNLYLSRSHLNLHTQGGSQSISTFFNKLFRRRETSTVRYRESST
ncbi:unnamed protein product [Rodentolepis nana]|uniref:Uncharacterized protein n=1 Tax=Rodentolepis nana TaxID=102285 RepID=A0A0R3TYH3_RODNA|nr:unnamed protein product [Rodentolepis nana]